ncbi:MAG: Nif3-like dinuclear metal center hexameric protein [Armatimonadota bacterium]|nr:Nif3-like dinuclear metal center hexameric protein [Armatimonadota bacterium]MDR7451889.1 Nif3-like dinuclear metal center hexameric protein [Armatimonadota bacterium]MDR7467614.1 Nif3-like dinuclear metal center hexameric protein [Armatimonadota bacterium]MDR7494425.1 Nif3-like dinuclear metal center hexameric protein [Armatimonadota bacterium]MDR7500405.1 Nif3-like dinuclear metal center hexameric protein [Armatimonadota bacterium]
MTTDEIMSLALELAGMDRVPEDSAVFVPGRNIRRVLFGVDVGAAEIALARALGFDLVIAHHPTGVYIDEWKVLARHIQFMTASGVPEEAAREAIADRIEATKLRGQISNADHVPSTARLLGMPFMNIHAPLDEIGRRRMRRQVDAVLADGRARVADVVEALAALPEMRAAPTTVQLVLGHPDHPVRTVVVAHGALTNGGYPVARTCFAHGVDVVVYIHIDYADLQRLRAEGRGNLIITGHLAGDAVGFTPFLAALRRRGLEVTTFSGVIEPPA